MKAFQGKAVHPGMAVGPIHLYRRSENTSAKSSQLSPKEELERYYQASAQAILQLRQLQQASSSRLGKDLAAIFLVQEAILEDPDFLAPVRRRILQGASAEHAVTAAGEQCAKLLLATKDNYLCARVDDIRDLTRRVCGILSGQMTAPKPLPGILIAEELSPSEAVGLDTRSLLGIVSSKGSSNSHTAILARAMDIPSLTGVTIDPEWDGHMAVLDGDSGTLWLDPDETVLVHAREVQQQRYEQHQKLLDQAKVPCVTRDGYKVRLCANISSPQEATRVRELGCEGIGLFRSEYLFLGRNTCPSEEEQFISYQQTVLAMEGRPVIIRTLDVGADKDAPCLTRSKEENPALGCRGIRYSLAHPDLFCQQLRAILRAAAYGQLSVMFPMVTSVQEIQQAKALMSQCRKELDKQGIPYGPVQVGTMIETPAAVIMADELGKEVDFFSLGTNDLTQYTLAADRLNPDVESVYAPGQPALLRLIRHTVDAGHRCGCWVGLCGELAAEPKLTRILLQMGLDELSVSPSALLPLREKIANLTLELPVELPVT